MHPEKLCGTMEPQQFVVVVKALFFGSVK